jgi:hypothetical protein
MLNPTIVYVKMCFLVKIKYFFYQFILEIKLKNLNMPSKRHKNIFFPIFSAFSPIKHMNQKALSDNFLKAVDWSVNCFIKNVIKLNF